MVREWPAPFSPARAIADVAEICKRYGIKEVFGDKYAVGFVEQEFKGHDIKFTPAEATTSEHYILFLQQVMNERVRLVENETLRRQLIALERHVTPSGGEKVDHPRNGHDDVAAAVAGAIVMAATAQRGWFDLSNEEFESANNNFANAIASIAMGGRPVWAAHDPISSAARNAWISETSDKWK